MQIVIFKDFKLRERVDCHNNIQYQFKSNHIIYSKPIKYSDIFNILNKKGLLPVFNGDLNKLISRSDLNFFYKLIRPDECLNRIKDTNKLKPLIEIWKKGYYVVIQEY